MGVDLQLLPVECESSKFCFSHSVLSLERRRELWAAIEESKIEKPFNKKLSCYVAITKDGDRGYGEIEETTYGNKITYATSEELLRFKGHEAVTDNHQNMAVWAYLEQLPPDTKIILYWS